MTFLITCSLLSLAVFVFGLAGLGRLFGDVVAIRSKIGERHSAHIYTGNGSLGFTVIHGDPVVITAIDEGRGSVPFFAHRPGFLLFDCSIGKTWTGTYWETESPITEEDQLLGVPFIDVKVTRSDLCVPVWLVVLVFAIYPVYSLILIPIRRESRRRAGLCVNCAYDMRGCTSDVCPECGTRIPPAPEDYLRPDN